MATPNRPSPLPTKAVATANTRASLKPLELPCTRLLDHRRRNEVVQVHLDVLHAEQLTRLKDLYAQNRDLQLQVTEHALAVIAGIRPAAQSAVIGQLRVHTDVRPWALFNKYDFYRGTEQLRTNPVKYTFKIEFDDRPPEKRRAILPSSDDDDDDDDSTDSHGGTAKRGKPSDSANNSHHDGAFDHPGSSSTSSPRPPNSGTTNGQQHQPNGVTRHTKRRKLDLSSLSSSDVWLSDSEGTDDDDTPDTNTEPLNEEARIVDSATRAMQFHVRGLNVAGDGGVFSSAVIGYVTAKILASAACISVAHGEKVIREAHLHEAMTRDLALAAMLPTWPCLRPTAVPSFDAEIAWDPISEGEPTECPVSTHPMPLQEPRLPSPKKSNPLGVGSLTPPPSTEKLKRARSRSPEKVIDQPAQRTLFTQQTSVDEKVTKARFFDAGQCTIL